MITLKYMTWSNWFSYGDSNAIEFSRDTLTQIIGENGSGKSSIPLILEEVLYGKNSKGIKKGDIPNRLTNTNKLEAMLIFNVDESEYRVELVRRASIKLSLYKDGVDISSHTSRGTYESIENILGIDFKTFTQLTYQSSKSSLGFLTATDANRKAFLVALFGLDEYAKYLEIYKEASRELVSSKSILSGECKSLSDFITKYSAMDFNIAATMKVIDKPVEEAKELGVLEESFKNLATTNTGRTKNNTYKTMLDAIDMSFLSYSGAKPRIPVYKVYDNKDRILAEGKIADAIKELNELKLVGSGSCPKCRQAIDKYLLSDLIDDNEEIIDINNEVVEDAIKVAKQFEDKHKKLKSAYTSKLAEYNKMQKNLTDFETLTAQFDTTLETDLIDSQVLRTDIQDMKAKINEINDNIDEAVRNNTAAVDKNSKIKVVKKQLEEHRTQLDTATKKLAKIEILEANVNLLKKAFSTTGLVAFKLEFLSKTLEKEINRYLGVLSSGRFQLEFILEKEKLNIEIQDDGNGISIVALSSGELARVNAATLLAIRNMMSKISGNKINLLILDEVLGVLDTDGKESLIALLLEEHGLNTFLVDHSFSHPLLSTINITKKNGVSSIEQED